MFSIVHFAPISWQELQKNGYRKTSGGMLKALLERSDVNHVWYVEHDRRWGFHKKITRVDPHLTVVSLPIGLPYERFSIIRWINRHLQAFILLNTIPSDQTKPKNIYWFYDWWDIELIKLLPRAQTIMEVTDRADQFIEQTRNQFMRLHKIQEQALEIVDFIFPVSEALVTECQGAKGKVIVLRNGISGEFLKQARIIQPEPSELRGLSHPRMCVVSTGWPMNYRLDHKLLLEFLDRMPQWKLILIGCEKIESDALEELIQNPQVLALGLMPNKLLIPFIQHCDVCAVPYTNESKQTGDRLKIYEYLACHKPIILTENIGQSSTLPYLRFAFSTTELVQACNDYMQNAPPFQSKWDNLLDGMTWDKRAEKILGLIQKTE